MACHLIYLLIKTKKLNLNATLLRSFTAFYIRQQGCDGSLDHFHAGVCKWNNNQTHISPIEESKQQKYSEMKHQPHSLNCLMLDYKKIHVEKSK